MYETGLKSNIARIVFVLILNVGRTLTESKHNFVIIVLSKSKNRYKYNVLPIAFYII